ncbi:MAG: hypothetical protein NVS3B12_21780 [Acidimicrobiales bacterium]
MKHALVIILLVVGVGTQAWSCLGVCAMADAMDRLHFTAPATTLGIGAVGMAMVLEFSLSTMGIKAILVVVLVGVTNPILTHATARALRVRAHGRWQVDDELAGPPQGTM